MYREKEIGIIPTLTYLKSTNRIRRKNIQKNVGNFEFLVNFHFFTAFSHCFVIVFVYIFKNWEKRAWSRTLAGLRRYEIANKQSLSFEAIFLEKELDKMWYFCVWKDENMCRKEQNRWSKKNRLIENWISCRRRLLHGKKHHYQIMWRSEPSKIKSTRNFLKINF